MSIKEITEALAELGFTEGVGPETASARNRLVSLNLKPYIVASTTLRST